MNFDVRPAVPRDLSSAIELLHAAGLPTEDMTSEHLALVAERDKRMLAVIGLEVFGEIGLLRSLVVSPRARGDGVGRLLLEALESSARERGIRELWLLTIDADAFFSSRGYLVRDREVVPAAIRDTEEFSALCPGDAVLMSKLL